MFKQAISQRSNFMWANESVFYQIYPFGACGAPFENDHVLEHRIHKLEDFIPHLKKLKIDCIMLNPIFESRTHGIVNNMV